MVSVLVVLCLFIVATTTRVVAASYAAVCDSTFCHILDDSYKEIDKLKNIVTGGSCIPKFGQTADELCNSALERFSLEAPMPDDSTENEAIYDKKIEDLERLLDAPLHVVYLKQLSLVRERSFKTFKEALAAVDASEFDAMMKADAQFRAEAEAATRQSPEWSYSKEIASLKAALAEVAARSRKVAEVQVQATKQNQQAMQFLQMQQQQMQAIQQQVSGQSSPWNIGMAYRVPDSNINLSGTYSQGKGNLQISCVPDESMSLLGPNGFVHGVTPGNLGISFNINI